MGDRVVTLAPAEAGKVVTSETGTVTVLGADGKSLAVRMDDGDAVVVLSGEEIGADRLANGFAVTVHRSQGATVERAHVLEDGGGRELAYVKMSRSTDRSAVYVVADSVEHAAEDLQREWKVERRLPWVIDRSPATGRPGPDRRDVDAALRRGQLLAERHTLLAGVHADPTAAIRAAERELDGIRCRRADLETGRGTCANHPLNRAVLDFEQADANVNRLRGNLDGRRLPRRERREKEAELAKWRARHAAAAKALDDLVTPERRRLDQAGTKLADRLSGLHEQRDQRADWFARHPDAARRLDGIQHDVETLNAVADPQAPEVGRWRGPARNWPWLRDTPVIERGLDISLGR